MADQQQPKVPDLPDIIGPSLQSHLDRLVKWKDSKEPILFLGETGTGKELFARYLARFSGKDIHPVNCIGISESLFESELFGHEKGAFTGADRRQIGLVEKALDGIIFLDEIGDLPDHTQGKILRLVQFGEYKPVGLNKNKHARCRFFAASNKKDIRADLMERFINFRIPPLWGRGEDIYYLLQHFLSKEGYKYITLLASLLLIEYKWEGNVREIEKTCHRFAVERGGETLNHHDVSTDWRFSRILYDIELAEKELHRYALSSPFYAEIISTLSPENARGKTKETVLSLDKSFPSELARLVGRFRFNIWKIEGLTPPMPPYLCHYSDWAKSFERSLYRKIDSQQNLQKADVKDSPFDEVFPTTEKGEKPNASPQHEAETGLFDSTSPDELQCKWLKHHLRQGLTKEEIAVKAGRSKATIYKWIKKFGLDQ